MHTFSIAIHGGAGTILKSEITPELEEAYHTGLKEALHAGYTVLEKKGSALEAVKAAVIKLEDNVLFNAGKGSVFTKKGKHEMDASIMDGKTLDAGAVASVKNIRNPVLLAEAVMKCSNHVLLSGEGAMDFAKEQKITTEPDDYFYSQFRYKQWQQLQSGDAVALDHSAQAQLGSSNKMGTVGAVACDKYGNVAAATSTGGMTNKNYGRIGDTPIIGAGTYADNKTAAISCTGHGEPFIKAVAAFSVIGLMEHKNYSLHEAMKEIVHQKLIKFDGEGGMIGVDAQGNVAMQFNSEGMYRAMKSSAGNEEIKIYKD
ncbi:MAG: isoaspartyl peptidase/L-asparaginase [Chitinophagaceae bacterium]|jgi:beta-aspartyl-peptidase (threonine type)|nr:isoaspartyl peptidase/L-asparaginase [Chitinophagaceae bacterium]HOV44597.1 isoaspartyl peptidase/L-asparaginase [Ferruginibacter sp.]MBK7347346.1 isoaspartyl peptidase/L-asparaginase [Chitinophagaceae bacterium]MBK8774453.1 isoaspartyl peptidase/L-asparaginase [Chitinophagaceae bacterium]MBK8929115.1 isoaspartyl peptidase/L-asparaginase [Chitinophagaceae bacterium]